MKTYDTKFIILCTVCRQIQPTHCQGVTLIVCSTVILYLHFYCAFYCAYYMCILQHIQLGLDVTSCNVLPNIKGKYVHATCESINTYSFLCRAVFWHNWCMHSSQHHYELHRHNIPKAERGSLWTGAQELLSFIVNMYTTIDSKKHGHNTSVR